DGARSVQSREAVVTDARDRERRRLGTGAHGPGALRGHAPAAFGLAFALLQLASETRDRAHLLHHLLDVLELLDQRGDVTGHRAAPGRDAGPSGAVDDRGVHPFERRHGPDDRLDTVQLAVVDLLVLHLFGQPGDHADQVAERTHLADLLQLLEEVLEGELT